MAYPEQYLVGTAKVTSFRQQLYGQLVRLLNQDASLVYLYDQVNYMAVTKKISGIQYFSDGIPRVAFAGYTS